LTIIATCHDKLFGGDKLKYREITKMIELDGWYWKRSSGSHQIYRHSTKPGIVVVAYHGTKEIPEGTVKSILKQAGLE
jgi:predicted RNA binding protein YcfA (HicA-like mRNA interferase family)